MTPADDDARAKLDALLYQYKACHAEKDEARAIARRLAAALDVCDGHRGAFSCAEPHDMRCLKARGKPNAACECGRDELDAAVAAFDALPWATDDAAGGTAG